ncbi:MAG: hypothetical protein NC253_06575 [Ruminococcus sp.]|nr:hypothetical protein [Ruminococcus sp.]MCM1380418.1 hypothetical protein [Muribaculaceae bacterium]MCM1478914.1 hypothetical protein [Muribaculaceae bacterium]
MNMKLSYRDKVIFIVVIVIIILVAGFFLFIQPKFQEVESAKFNLETKKQERADMEAKIATLDTIIEDIKSVADEIGEKQGIFLEEQDPYLNETYIREAFAAEGLEVRSMNTTYTTAGAINRYTVSPAHILAYDNKMSADLYNELPQEVYDAYNNVAPEAFPNTIIGVTTVNATLSGGTDPVGNANKVMNRIAEDEKTIVLNTISTSTEDEASGGENGEEVSEISATITMYSIYPLNVEQVKQESAEIKPIETETPEETPAE